MIQRFTAYRRAVPATHDSNQANPPDEPQFEGVIFSDGSVAIRWRTACRSTSVWGSLEDAMAIHGHPEYDTYIVWHDGGGWAPIAAAPKDGTQIRVTYQSKDDGQMDDPVEVHWGFPKAFPHGVWQGGTKEKPEDWVFSHPSHYQPLTGFELKMEA